MCPHQRDSSASRSPESQALGRNVRAIPDLFGNQSDADGKVLDGGQVRIDIPSSSQLVRGPFASQQRPWSPHAPAQERGSVIALAITIMIVALPAWAFRRIDLQH